jgi:hypothetical protein
VRIDHGFQLAIENCKSFASLCFGGEVGVGGLSLSRTCGGIAMKRAIAFTLFASAAVGFAQQNKDPVSSAVKEILPHQGNKPGRCRRGDACGQIRLQTHAAADELCHPRNAHDGIEQLPLRQGWRRP